ncbi:MAG: hypothetical protein CSB44_02875 [Gammaproteobacteria bacterium]|nr:MAG: hypothetical protein CSB44_02875 [Gammaproteobacteria bacterium]PIE36592.1 MAG: hypothetical protein CSA54_04045 [Gammaproteobacteria bacterium]
MNTLTELRSITRRLFCLLTLSAVLISTPAAAWQVETLEGERRDLLTELNEGRPSLVFIWSLSCVSCESQKPMLNAFYREHGKAGHINVIGLALDGPSQKSAIAERVASGQLDFPNYVALDDVFHRQFEEVTGGKTFRATPTYLLFDAQGAFVGAHSAPLAPEALESLISER